jgi:hypothetical protein
VLSGRGFSFGSQCFSVHADLGGLSQERAVLRFPEGLFYLFGGTQWQGKQGKKDN